jgi:tetratricopeptide (TPR) repeat protein
MLDAEEYFHLALHANSTADHHSCMEYLNEVLQQQPQHARAIYLLAVQHAALGLSERAATGFKAALAIEPELELARFQLGLLLLFDKNRPLEAKEHFAQLHTSRDPALRTCAEALTTLAEGNPVVATQKLELALSHASSNPGLSMFAQRLLERLAKDKELAGKDSQQMQERAYLGAYGQTSS